MTLNTAEPKLPVPMKFLKVMPKFHTVCAASLLFATSLAAQQVGQVGQVEHQENVIVAPGDEKTAGFAAKDPGITFQLDVKPGGGHKFETGGHNGILGENRDSTFWQLEENTPDLKTYKVLVNRTDDGHEAVFKMRFKQPEGGGGGGGQTDLPPAYVKAVNCFVKIHTPGTIAAPGTLIPTPTVAGKTYYGILLRNTDEDITLGTEDHTTGSKTGDGLTKDNDLVKVELSWNPTALRADMVEGKELVLELPMNTKAYLTSGVELTDFTVPIGSGATGEQLAALGGGARKQNIYIEGNHDWNGGNIILKVDKLNYSGAESKALLLPIIINKVGFTNVHDIASDDLSTPYVSPQWKDLDGDRKSDDVAGGEHNYSIAYTRYTKPTIAAEMSVPGLPAGVTVNVSAVGTDGVNILTEPSSTTGSTVTLNPKQANKKFPDKVRFYERSVPSNPADPASPKSTENAFNLEWKLNFSDIGEMPAGTTSHQAYITYAAPSPALRQETLFNLGSRNAHNENVEKDVVTAIWSDFKPDAADGIPRLFRVLPPGAAGPALPMTYYANSAAPYLTVNTLNQLLATGDGRCGTFQGLLHGVLQAQGIDSALISVEAPKVGLADARADYFATYGSVPDADYPGIIKDVFFVKNWTLSATAKWTITDLVGEAGQGNSDPIAIFGDHALLEYDGEIYDPSYGTGPFSNITEWEDESIVGFGVQFVKAGFLSSDFKFWTRKLDTKGTQEVITP